MLMQYQLILISLSILCTPRQGVRERGTGGSNEPMTMQYQLISISLSILRTPRQGVRERGTGHWARMVADYGVALPGRQVWRCIEWPAAHHSGVEGVQADELMVGVEDIQADELRGSVGRTYELM